MRGEVIKDIFDNAPEIDFNSGYRSFLGNFENYLKALMSTLKSIKSKLPLLQSMNFTEEYEGLRTITSTLRIMIGSIGANGIADASYKLETALLNDDNLYIQEQMPYYIISLIELSDHLEILLKKLDVKGMARGDEDNSSFLNKDFTKTKESIKLSNGLLDRKII